MPTLPRLSVTHVQVCPASDEYQMPPVTADPHAIGVVGVDHDRADAPAAIPGADALPCRFGRGRFPDRILGAHPQLAATLQRAQRRGFFDAAVRIAQPRQPELLVGSPDRPGNLSEAQLARELFGFERAEFRIGPSPVLLQFVQGCDGNAEAGGDLLILKLDPPSPSRLALGVFGFATRLRSWC